MNYLIIAAILAIFVSVDAYSFQVETPEDLQFGSFMITSPDDEVNTLGKVSMIIDLAAERDTPFELRIRRANLTLDDGRPITAFSYSSKSGLIVGAGGNVSKVSLAGVNAKGDGRELAVLFHNQTNEIIAPDQKDIAVFDMAFKRIRASYDPLATPHSLGLPVSVLLDTSGSMGNFMPDLKNLTKNFLNDLPSFASCQLYSFADEVKKVGGEDRCTKAAGLVDGLNAEGATSLYDAIGEAVMSDKGNRLTGIPRIVIAVTDGKDTASKSIDTDQIKKIKSWYNAKVFVFWLGNYEPSHLKGIADIEVVATQNKGDELATFFRDIGISVSGLQRILVL